MCEFLVLEGSFLKELDRKLKIMAHTAETGYMEHGNESYIED